MGKITFLLFLSFSLLCCINAKATLCNCPSTIMLGSNEDDLSKQKTEKVDAADEENEAEPKIKLTEFILNPIPDINFIDTGEIQINNRTVALPVCYDKVLEQPPKKKSFFELNK